MKELVRGKNYAPVFLYRALKSYVWENDEMMREYWFDQWVFEVKNFTNILPI